MRSFSPIDFVAHVSKMNDYPVLFISVDPYFGVDTSVVDSTFDPDETVLEALEGIIPPDAALTISENYTVTMICADLEEAYGFLTCIEEAFPDMTEINLIASVYCRGELLLCLQQNGQIHPQITRSLQASA